MHREFQRELKSFNFYTFNMKGNEVTAFNTSTDHLINPKGWCNSVRSCCIHKSENNIFRERTRVRFPLGQWQSRTASGFNF
ncbi:hypothetical protein GYH30_025377 [Glycine max]|uniref:Uncharacterized protein n=1 Tax=Glycine max TaxID=3847 RepID=A0A0R0IFU2_SOYBN|nr:hypothetical protein JHK86_025571 [Glycine max]KAH1043504.1 hypothetical protein GYH30_025377 [Glycine max]